MFSPAEASAMSEGAVLAEGSEPDAETVFADRIDLLFRLGRHHLFLPFSALCIVGILYTGQESISAAVFPLQLQILAIIVTGMVARGYNQRDPSSSPHTWANRYTLMSAASGGAWGVGAVVWFIHGFFPAQAFLTLAFLGMTATEFIARCAHRPSYVAHAVFSLGPLALMLFFAGSIYSSLTSVLVLFFGGILYSYCDGIASWLDESIRLRHRNATLVKQLSREIKEVETARDMAEASTRAKSAFVANISHEIRTPLNALLGMAQLLERSDLDRMQRSHVKVLLEAGHGLKVLLDDVIALSRDEGEARHEQDEDCDAAQAARTVARLLQPRAWEKQLKLSVTAATNLPRVAADPRRVRQVLLKLAENAIKFTQRGCVEIRVHPEEYDGKPMLQFSVSDTGLGIPTEFAGHVFEPFAAGDHSYARRQEGAGLGLAVAKRIIEQFGGRIGFESETGQGSTFWFTVPAIRVAGSETTEALPIASDAPPPWGLSILMWCADESIRTHIGNMLEPFGNRLVFAQNLADATGLAGRESFDVIIVGAADADSFAAAPGVRAPILAIVSSGMRLPAAVGEVMRWPAAAGALYASLRDLLGRGADTGATRPQTHDQAIAAIDAPAFAALEKSLGLTTLIEILQSYIGTAENLCVSLSQASEHEGWDEASRIAQDIAGSAGDLGLAALTAAARAFAQKIREGDGAGELKSAARSIVEEHERVRKALANLYPELAA
jgi:signal transduction histidine kinase/HPt (histidine-containing phosphotransfer) domain-containing protein